MFSVIITTYGSREKDLKKAIDSVLNQTYQNFEIIIIDDNGKNKAQKQVNSNLINKYNNNKIKYYTYLENKGGNFARNYGINKSKKEFIAFLDDDDEFLENKLEEINKIILNNNDIDFIYSGGNIITEKKKKYFYTPLPSNLKYEILVNHIAATSFVVVRREKIVEVGLFNEELKSCQEWELWIRLIFSEAKVKGIDKPLINYKNNLTEKTRISNNFNKRLAGLSYIITETTDKYLKYLSISDRKQVLIKQKKLLGMLYYDNFKFQEYRKIYIELLKNQKIKLTLKEKIKYYISYLNLKVDSKGVKLKND